MVRLASLMPRLVAAAFALGVAIVATAPASAQQDPRLRDPLDKFLNPVKGYYDRVSGRWIYFDNGQAVVSVPARRVNQQQMRAAQQRSATTGRSVTQGRRYATGGNRTGTTRTQTIHVGEAPTRAPGGSRGRGR